MRVDGISATIELDDVFLTITHRGILGAMTVGAQGTRKIVLEDISSVQMRAATIMINGFIHFGTRGNDFAPGIIQAGNDPNAIFFRKNWQLYT